MTKTLRFLKDNYFLIGILAVAAVLRFFRLDYQSVWLDEIHTINEANPAYSFGEVSKALATGEQMPPLYFYIINVLFKVLGYSAWVLRFFSAALGVLGVYYTYRLGKEMLGRDTGLIAAMLLAVNSYHIFYSQEGRPYIFLYLFTVLSFLYLIKLVKNPDIRPAIIYGVVSAVMLYAHFFGMFILFGQYLILLLLMLGSGGEWKTLFKRCLLSGIITLAFFAPVIPTLFTLSKTTSFWIPPPTPEVFTGIFKEFFGSSEMILFIVFLFGIFYIISLRKNTAVPTTQSVLSDRQAFGFLIFAVWIAVTLLLPLIRSYLQVPMIISRYFIGVLPAIMILLSAGALTLRSSMIRNMLLAAFVVFSLTDIFVVKHYYTNVQKTQFREAAAYINDNNKAKSPIITSLEWYYPYFFRDVKGQQIVGSTIDNYVAGMAAGTSPVSAFWYTDAHGRPYKPSEQTLAFLNTQFVVDYNFEGFDIYAKHFIPRKEMQTNADISKFGPLKPVNGDSFPYSIENMATQDGVTTLSGWAFFEGQATDNSLLRIVLLKDGKPLFVDTNQVSRPDVTDYFKSPLNLSGSGFSATVSHTALEPGTYQVALHLSNGKTGKEGLIITDKIISK